MKIGVGSIIYTSTAVILVSICVAQPVAQEIEVDPSSNVADSYGLRSKRTPFGLGLVKLGAVGVGLGTVGAIGAAKAFHHFGGYGYKHGGYYGGDYYGGGYGYGPYKKPYHDYGYVEAYPIYGGHHGGYGGGYGDGYGHGYGHGHPGGYGGGSVASASAYASSSSGSGYY